MTGIVSPSPGTAPAGTVLVTGASGFVGRHLARTLAARGTPVRGLVRPASRALPPGVERVEIGDLSDTEGLRRAMEGAATVVHLAARVHVMRERAADPLAEFRRVNVEGTRAVLAAARQAGVRAVVFASSVKAVGEENERPWTDGHPAVPVDPYGVSKLEAEALVRSAAGAMHTVTLRLPLVYGPGVKGNMLRLFQLVDRGLPLPFGRVRNRRSLLGVANLAAAVNAVLGAAAARGETFFVSDGQPVSTPELVRAIAAALGRPARLLPVPESVFRAAGRAGDLLHLPAGSAAVNRLLNSLSVDSSRLARLCGYTPPCTLAQGLAHTARWYRGAPEDTLPAGC